MKIDEIPTYEEILQRCLDRVPSKFDKRQGSIIYDAIAPCAAELAQLYIKLFGIYEQVFIDTAVGEDLDKLVKQNGVTRKDATYALRKGEFNMVIPVGSRFSDGTNAYTVESNIDGTNNSRLRCETAGSAGNTYYGPLTMITYIDGLTKAELTDIIDLGDDIESDEILRERFMESVTAPQYGGNISDYQNKVRSLTGVGGCKVIPIWNGGGTVKLIITNSLGESPLESLINDVQEAVDPQPQQQGLGIAPIGHKVTVVGAETNKLTFGATLVLSQGTEAQDVQEKVNEAVDQYLYNLSRDWDKEDHITVRISQLEIRLLSITGVVDVSNITINGGEANVELASEEIPKREGNVVING